METKCKRFVYVAGTFILTFRNSFLQSNFWDPKRFDKTFPQRKHNVFKRCGNVLSKRLGTQILIEKKCSYVAGTFYFNV